MGNCEDESVNLKDVTLVKPQPSRLHPELRLPNVSRCAMTRSPQLLLGLVLVALGCSVAAARPCDGSKAVNTDDWRHAVPTAMLGSESMPPTEVAHHGDCTSTCDNADTPKELDIECWGTYLLVCKGNSSIMVTKCEGHYIGMHILDKHMYLGVCEGLVHKFAHWTTTCPKTRASKTHFYGRGCLGGSSSIIKVLPEPEPDTVAGALTASVSMPSDAQMDALAAALPKMDLQSVGDGHGAAFESRCSGRGGEVFGVKWGAHEDTLDGQGSPQEVFDELHDSVVEHAGNLPEELQLGDQRSTSEGFKHITSDKTTQGSSQRSSVLATLVGFVRDDPHPPHPSCSLTCNGHNAWLHGMWPCYGKLEASCSTPDAPPGAKTMSFSASCKGLWTGALGKMCWGLTQQHTEKTWPTGSAESDAICMGSEGIWSSHKGDSNSGVFAMGQWCKGGSVGHMCYGKHDAEDSVAGGITASVAVA